MHIEGYGELAVDDIKLYQTSPCGKLFREPASFEVSYRVIKTGQYWGRAFSIKEWDGNISELGRKMGIRCRDKIPLCSPRGKAISEYVHRLAWKYARGLMPKGAEVKDETICVRKPKESPLAVSA